MYTLHFLKLAQCTLMFCFHWHFWPIVRLVAGVIIQPKKGTTTNHFQVGYMGVLCGPIVFTVWYLGLGFAGGTVSTVSTVQWSWVSIPKPHQYNIINIWQRWLHTEPHVGAFFLPLLSSHSLLRSLRQFQLPWVFVNFFISLLIYALYLLLISWTSFGVS